MLGRLAERLKAQTLEENTAKIQAQLDDHDSGTESDDETTKIKQLQQTMATVLCCGDSRLTRLGKKAMLHQRNHEPWPSPDAPKPQITNIRTTRRSTNSQRLRLAAVDHRDDDNIENISCGDLVPSDCIEPMGDSGLPSDSDHNVEYHSSEEELEMINCRETDSYYDEDAKSDAEDSNLCSKAPQSRDANVLNNNNINNNVWKKRKWSDVHALKAITRNEDDGDSSSDDDHEVRDLMVYQLTAPVQFRSSPPADAYKPSRYSVSPPPKFMHISSAQITPFEVCSVNRSTHRRRHRARQRNSSHVQRSYLDFDKMRQGSRMVMS